MRQMLDEPERAEEFTARRERVDFILRDVDRRLGDGGRRALADADLFDEQGLPA